jgi:hypothetical protein
MEAGRNSFPHILHFTAVVLYRVPEMDYVYFYFCRTVAINKSHRENSYDEKRIINLLPIGSSYGGGDITFLPLAKCED